MKFRISSQDLSAMAGSLSRFASKSIDNGFGVVVITASQGSADFRTSNPEQTISMSYSIDCDEEGEAIIEAHRFLAACRSFSSLVEIESKGNQLHIRQGKSNYKLPIAKDIILNELHSIDSDPKFVDLGDAIGKVSYALGTEPTNACGYYWFNDGAIAASNTAVLCEAMLEEGTGITACVPSSALKNIKGKVGLKYRSGQIDIIYNNIYLITRLGDHKFPPYKGVIPSHSNYVKVNRKDLIEMLNRVMVFCNSVGYVRMGITDSEVYVNVSNETSNGEDSISFIESTDFKIEVGVNVNYLLSTVNNIGGEHIDILFGTEMQPILVRNPERLSITALIMPMR